MDAALTARKTGLYGLLDSVGAVRVTGADASRFLHAQMTNVVEGLGRGEGNLSARVTRTGHLVEMVALYRLPEDVDGHAAFLLLLESERVDGLLDELEKYIFGDDLKLAEVSGDRAWMALQGPAARSVMVGAFGDLPEIPRLGAVRTGDVLILSRSLTGDPGFVVGIPWGSALIDRVQTAARGQGLVMASPEVLETLRIEAGMVKVGVDTVGRDRLLPETGLETQLVSYTKGCYLGQEVIARIRTYGSLPYVLRGIIFEETEVDDLPDVGSDLLLSGGTSVGQIVSRAFSPVMDAVVAMAYIDRDHRTPGEGIEIEGKGKVLKGQVVLLPFYRSGDDADGVLGLYDRAVRAYADGDEGGSVRLLEEALRLDPSFADGYEALGVILGKSGRFEEAIGIFRRLEEIAPEEPRVHTNLSVYYMKLGDKASAEEHGARAMQKTLDRSLAEQKREMFSRVLEIDPEDPIALFGLGNALFMLGEWDEAEKAYVRAVGVDGDNAAVFLARGKALEKLDRLEEAVSVYREGMGIASRKGDLMPLREMESRLLLLS